MMRESTRATAEAFKTLAAGGGGGATGKEEWEVRPSGMLVQKRNPDSSPAAPPPPVLRLRVKHGPSIHEIYISSQATVGELKRMVSGPTGLHHEDQKILFRDRERQSSAFLDACGVRDRSKLVVVVDEVARARRCLVTRRAARMEKAAGSISQIGRQVDKLATKVSAIEAIVSKGKKVTESDVLNLIEMLMNELIKLDGIAAEGDAKTMRRAQVKRVQKYVETLDMIKIKNESPPPPPRQNPKNNQNVPPLPAAAATTKWDMFDSILDPPTTSAAGADTKPAPRFDWELF
ncbi:protein binding protein [Iris pallida]|uniref:Protein binding protein n=1 Tax=Iris pallida TaxID=29817 RepID=A0AAX6HA70_IRIPA|nr:protein binding protein [Iris pallida]